MQQLTIEDKILIFKTLAISKPAHLCFSKKCTIHHSCSIRKNTIKIYLQKQKF